MYEQKSRERSQKLFQFLDFCRYYFKKQLPHQQQQQEENSSADPICFVAEESSTQPHRSQKRRHRMNDYDFS